MDLASPSLEGRTALVTGAARGLGFAIAQRLAARGAKVWIAGRDEAALAEAAERMGRDTRPLAFDLDSEADCARAMATFGADGLDILVNNAGRRDRRALGELDRGAMRAVLETNLLAPFDLARAAAPIMRRAGYGRIVNITSIAARIARGDAAYTASKAALEALTRALAAELGPDGITVNAVAPGYFATETNADMVADAGVAAHLERRTSLGRWGRPDEVAGAVAFLASAEAGYVTGETIAVDGGYLAHF